MAPGSRADRRLEVGDVIVQLNRHAVKSPSDVQKFAARADGDLLFLVIRGEEQTFVAVPAH